MKIFSARWRFYNTTTQSQILGPTHTSGSMSDELHAAHQNLPCYLLTQLQITMESYISNSFNITGWRKYAHQREKNFYSSKATMLQISAFYLNYFLTYEGSQKSKIALWCCKSVTQRIKILSMLKLLCISIHILNFSFLTQLLPEIWTGVLYLPLV